MKSPRHSLTIIVLLTIALCFIQVSINARESVFVWPSNGWQSSTPTEQGLDSKRNQSLLKDPSLKGNLMIIRNGYIVGERYDTPKGRDFAPSIFSCTKGIVSTLIGITIDQRLIKDVNQKVLDFYSYDTIANLDDNKKAITVNHLLSMTVPTRTYFRLSFKKCLNKVPNPTPINSYFNL
jgi:CubicO group peptidase (beta-lactamase class C family)